MPSPPPTTSRRITSDDLPVIAALNYAAMSCISFRLFDDAEAIVADMVEVYGRLPPILICRYAIRMASDNLDAVGSLAALSDVFTPAELAMPFFNLIRLTLIVTSLSALPGYGKRVAEAVAELRALVADPGQDATVRMRATNLIDHAERSFGVAA